MTSLLVIPEIFYRESKFLLFLWFFNTMDPGLKIAGVTGQGVIASSWFRLRGNPKFFTLSNLLFSFLRLRKARSPPQSLLAMT